MMTCTTEPTLRVGDRVEDGRHAKRVGIVMKLTPDGQRALVKWEPYRIATTYYAVRNLRRVGHASY
ncbi:hypothetical protein [Alicyclobacillus shizuokensis]|uniref:hypothetical protein n=1 Tax=Alicyclobacillus shizuokensis TaxID=392014 RepID=UPI0012ED8574|nr:hypothetical protein [Alicyclobacillus shizuokensis]